MTDAAAYTALLRGVCAEPHSDEPRLVLADWLEEHGEEERAEWIRACIAQAQTRDAVPYDAEVYFAAMARVDAVSDYDLGVWLHQDYPDRPLHFRCFWHRGFVQRVSCTYQEWLDHGPSFVLLHPVTAVLVTDKVPWTDTLNGGQDHGWWEDALGRWLMWDDPAIPPAELSAACVAWTRAQAGLPALVYPPSCHDHYSRNQPSRTIPSSGSLLFRYQ